MSRLLPLFMLLTACQGRQNDRLSREELLDPETCAECHPNHYEQWKGSMHAYAAEDPVQQDLDAAATFDLKGYQITPLADFKIRAKVLSREDYSMDAGAELSPVDLALGWGRMSDTAVLDRIDISQNGRFYFWRTKQYPIPRAEIISSSANMHIVPANDAVMNTLRWVRPGHLVTLKGKLIMAKSSDGGIWLSSTTRDDSGDGACELVYVEALSYH